MFRKKNIFQNWTNIGEIISFIVGLNVCEKKFEHSKNSKNFQEHFYEHLENSWTLLENFETFLEFVYILKKLKRPKLNQKFVKNVVDNSRGFMNILIYFRNTWNYLELSEIWKSLNKFQYKFMEHSTDVSRTFSVLFKKLLIPELSQDVSGISVFFKLKQIWNFNKLRKYLKVFSNFWKIQEISKVIFRHF